MTFCDNLGFCMIGIFYAHIVWFMFLVFIVSIVFITYFQNLFNKSCCYFFSDMLLFYVTISTKKNLEI